MKNLKLQSQNFLELQRIEEIRTDYPNFIFQSNYIYSLNHRFECRSIEGITEKDLNESRYFILNTRGYVEGAGWCGGNLPLSDYFLVNTSFEEDTASLPCGNWFAEAYFRGIGAQCELCMHIVDRTGYQHFEEPSADFHFTEFFPNFYTSFLAFSQRFDTWKKFKENKEYKANLAKLRTGYQSRETAASRKFYADTDKYYRNVLGLGKYSN